MAQRSSADGEGPSVLAARGISVSFGPIDVLADVDLTASSGEILGCIGPNGAGKTTLLNVLSGFQLEHRGTVSLGAGDLTGASPERRSRRGVVRTFQAARLFAKLTVAENIEVFAGSRHRRTARRRSVIAELLELGGLTELAALPAAALPQGLQRTVAVMRALALEPAYVLLDEPAAGLDDRESARLADVIRGIPSRKGCGVVLVEHDMPLVMAVCDRIHVLDQGRTLTVGTPAEVRADPHVRKAYLGPDSEDVAS